MSSVPEPVFGPGGVVKVSYSGAAGSVRSAHHPLTASHANRKPGTLLRKDLLLLSLPLWKQAFNGPLQKQNTPRGVSDFLSDRGGKETIIEPFGGGSSAINELQSIFYVLINLSHSTF